MANHDTLSREINQMKRQLEQTVQKYKYNFRHPKVIEVSQKLDGLIVLLMKKA